MLIDKNRVLKAAPSILHDYINNNLIWAVQYNTHTETYVSWTVSLSSLKESALVVLNKNLQNESINNA